MLMRLYTRWCVDAYASTFCEITPDGCDNERQGNIISSILIESLIEIKFQIDFLGRVCSHQILFSHYHVFIFRTGRCLE